MANDVVVSEQAVLDGRQMKQQVATIQDLMRAVLREGEHYMTIPGTPKPSLLQNGADKLMLAFHLHPIITHEREIDENNVVHFTSTASIVHNQTGREVGQGRSTANSGESKWMWRAAVCQEEFDETPPHERRLHFKKGGTRIPQVRTNHYDLEQTILSMSIKRAVVQGVKRATAAGDIFTVDIEDMDPNLLQSDQPTSSGAVKNDVMTLTEFNPPELNDKGKPTGKRKFFVWKFTSESGKVEATSFQLPKTSDGVPWGLGDMEAVVGTELKPIFSTTVSKGRRYVNLTHLDYVGEAHEEPDGEPDAVELEEVEV